MNIVLAWLILGAVLAAVSFVLPALTSFGDYWEAWRAWNLFIWSILVGAGLVALAIVWALAQLNVLS